MIGRAPILRAFVAFALFGLGVLAARWANDYHRIPGSLAAGPRRPAAAVIVPKPEWEIAFETKTGAARWLPMLAALERGDRATCEHLLLRAGQSGSMTRLIIAGWTTRDPQAVYDFLASHQDTPHGGNPALVDVAAATMPFLEKLETLNPDEMMALLDARPDCAWKRKVTESLLGSLIDTRPAAALALAASIKATSISPGEGFATWAAENPERATTLVAQLPAGEARDELNLAIAAAWAQHDPAAALRWAGTLGERSRHNALEGIIGGWVQQDAAAAAAFLTGLPSGQRARLANVFVESWAADDPRSALTWIEENLKSAARKRAIERCIEVAGMSDVSKALALISELDDAPLLGVASLASRWASQAPGDAAAWALSLEDETAREMALSRIAHSWSAADPQAIQEFIRATPPEKIPADMVSIVTKYVANDDPQAALTFARSLPPLLRAGAAQAAVIGWAGNAPAEAAAYVTQNFQGAEREQAIPTIAALWISTEPAAAYEWIATLPATEREALLESGLMVSPEEPE